jgi:hypothetical protein
VLEFPVDLGIGLVAAGRHIEIVQQHVSPPEPRSSPPDGGVSPLAQNSRRSTISIGVARDRGDAVIALLAADRDMGIAERHETA